MINKIKIVLSVFLVLIITLGFASKIQIQNNSDLTIVPNPFKYTTTITVNSEVKTSGTLKISTLQNIEILTLYQGNFNVGENIFTWDGTDNDGLRLPSGKYFIEFSTNNRYTSIKKIIMLK